MYIVTPNKIKKNIVCKLLAKDCLAGNNQSSYDSSWTNLITYEKMLVSLNQEDAREK